MPRKTEATTKTLRVLFVAAEADPIIKVGGLGDVTGTLPRAIQALGQAKAASQERLPGYKIDIRLVIPLHPAIHKRGIEMEPSVKFSVPHPNGPLPAQAFLTHLGEGQDCLPVYLISGEPIEREGPVYSLVTSEDGKKFTFFSLAALELAKALNFQPHILHVHDWHPALAVSQLKRIRSADPFFAQTRSVLTIHNLAYMGAGTEAALREYGIAPLEDPRLPWWGAYQPLPMGLATADYLTTVSPTYAREIMRPEFSCGLEDFLRRRASSISGILNGLDERAWDPQTDQALTANFSRETLDQRLANKQALIREFGLPPNIDLPLLIVISRFDRQKGIDLALEALRQISGLSWQAIFLGTGDPGLEEAARKLESEFPYRVRAAVRFDAKLSRRMYAGGDMILMPSRYEPCGLAQMIAMRYGCVPVARATGGLRDTVLDTPSAENSTGFLFEDARPEALAAALRRAILAYNEPQKWRTRQLCGMQQDFSWEKSAQEYVKLYDHLLTHPIPE